MWLRWKKISFCFWIGVKKKLSLWPQFWRLLGESLASPKDSNIIVNQEENLSYLILNKQKKLESQKYLELQYSKNSFRGKLKVYGKT